jgi:hypothetical protein
MRGECAIPEPAGLPIRAVFDETDALPLVLETELLPAAVLALLLAGRHARERAHRHPDRLGAGGHRGGAIGRELADRAYVLEHPALAQGTAFQSSAPCVPSSALKKSLPATLVSPKGSEYAAPG